MKIRVAIVAAGCVVLSACAQYDAQQQAEAATQAKVRAANDDAQCRADGSLPKSPGFIQCRTNLDNRHAAAVQPQSGPS